MLAAAAGGLACMCALLYLPGLTFAGLRLLLAALGFFCSANIVSYAVSHDISPPAQAGLALGFLNTCFYAGNAVSQPLVGWLLDLRAAARGAAGIAEPDRRGLPLRALEPGRRAAAVADRGDPARGVAPGAFPGGRRLSARERRREGGRGSTPPI